MKISAGEKSNRLVNWLIPPRIQGFEFCDQPWLKGVWRDAYLDGLNFILWVGGIYSRVHEPFGKWVRRAGNRPVQDLASGGGRPITTLVNEAGRNNVRLPKMILSDLHPDTEAFAAIARDLPGRVEYVSDSVDATDPGAGGARLFSICGAFHHFPPAAARRMLANVAARGDGIFIQEIFDRQWWALGLCVFNLVPLMLVPFFSKRFSFKKLLITTILPIIPLMIMFDGIVSIFRTYRPEEIIAMIPGNLRNEWRWEQGSCSFMGFLGAPYVCGYRPVYGDRQEVAVGAIAVTDEAIGGRHLAIEQEVTV
ncbi:MAG: hypothetical protein C0404_04065 [Verrucomicrobia bacterium]|nr:hypothetical protein [Verrucomicrobiota bacterium]